MRNQTVGQSDCRRRDPSQPRYPTTASAESFRNCDPSGIRTFPGRFDDNRGTTRTCIEGVEAFRRVPEFRSVVATNWQQNLGRPRIAPTPGDYTFACPGQDMAKGNGKEHHRENPSSSDHAQMPVMTPQLQLAIRLLQLSRVELVDMVREEMLKNPILEDSVESANEQAKATAGRQYSGEEPTYITPNVYIQEVSDQYVAVANDDGLPKLESRELLSERVQERPGGARSTSRRSFAARSG